MFRNILFILYMVVVGGSIIFAQVQPLIPLNNFNDALILETTTSTSKKTETTTTATPSSTTVKSTTIAPSPKPNPTPIPEPPLGLWNSSCIMLQMAVQLNFTYETIDKKNATAIYNIPNTAVVHDAVCESNTTQEIVLNWGPETAIHSMAIFFERNYTKANVHTIYIILPIDVEEFTNATANQTVQLVYRGDIFEAPFHMSYHCTRAQKFNLTDTLNDKFVVGTIRLSDVQIEAFRVENTTQFSEARDCDSSESPDIVPIAVGIALVALILIVLMSYLCARRRSDALGYMSF